MTTQELRELDAWIRTHVMNWVGCLCKNGIHPKFGKKKYAEIRNSNQHWVETWPEVEPDIKCDHFPHYTTDPAAAMDVLKKCAEKCGVRICYYSGRSPMGWDIYATDGTTKQSEAETLELAICLFAKQLFSKTTK